MGDDSSTEFIKLVVTMMKILEMTGIHKSFFGVNVLEDVSLDVEKGEVHALLGENGAGKSTLMNILGGVLGKDQGEVIVGGKQVSHMTVKSAEELGIAFVHQELNVINDLCVYENLFLNKELTRKMGSLRKKEMIRQSRDLFSRLCVEMDPLAMVGDLDASRKQLLEIAKAFHGEAQLFILDEPTTALNQVEVEHLFQLVRKLCTEGKSFIFISHKMPEIFEIAHRYTILRNGKRIFTGTIEEATPESVTRQMVGERYRQQEVYENRTLGKPVLDVCNLCGPGFQDISLSVRRGEVMGFTGLKGAGSSELMQSIFGIVPFSHGELRLWGHSVKKHTIRRLMRNRVAMLAADRKENSVIPDATLLENYYLSEHCLSEWRPHIFRKREISKYERIKKKMNIRAERHDMPIISLSGGNQQKVIFSRWLNTEAEILLLDNPTQGIDVGAKAEIYQLILDLAKEGKTILVNTLEIPEIQKVADRCAVFYHGQLQVILEREDISEEQVMLYATNAVGTTARAQGGERQ